MVYSRTANPVEELGDRSSFPSARSKWKAEQGPKTDRKLY